MRSVLTQGYSDPLIVTQGFGGVGFRRAGINASDAAVTQALVADSSPSVETGPRTMPYNHHDLGDLVKVSVDFTDELLEVATDPDVVNLSIREPDGTVTVYVYNSGDGVIVRDGVGQFHAAIDVQASGTWYYRWWSTGEGQASEERRFVVREAQAVE